MSTAFVGKVAVVTGAASGIGLGLAERFAAEGMKVVMADIEVAALEQAAAGLPGGTEVLDDSATFAYISNVDTP